MTDLTDKHPIPAFLRRHGVTAVSDNIGEGQRLRAPARRFTTLFRAELMALCVKTPARRTK